MLVVALLQRVDVEDRVRVAQEIAETSAPAQFLVELVRWLRAEAEWLGRGVLDDDGIARTAERFVRKIAADSCLRPMFEVEPWWSPSIYAFWSEWGDRNELRSHIRQALEGRPEAAVSLLRSYSMGGAWYERGSYDRFVEVVEPGLVLE